MIDESDQTLNDLLSRWHTWAADGRTALGYPTVSVSAKQYRCSRQYDDANGSLDQDIESVIMSGVDSCVWSLDDPYRTAIHINARNLCTGVSVWGSPRLPEDDFARALLICEARGLLLRKLESRELI